MGVCKCMDMLLVSLEDKLAKLEAKGKHPHNLLKLKRKINRIKKGY